MAYSHTDLQMLDRYFDGGVVTEEIPSAHDDGVLTDEEFARFHQEWDEKRTQLGCREFGREFERFDREWMTRHLEENGVL